MARILVAVHETTPDEKFSSYLGSLDDDKLACKAGRHNLPKLKPGKLPQGTDVRRRRGGVYQITLECLDCGLPATLVTGRGGILDPEEHWLYDYKLLPGYLAPRGTGRAGRKADYKRELGVRLAADIRQAAVQTSSRDAAAKRIASAHQAATSPRVRRPHNAHATNPRARRATRDGERLMHAERPDLSGGDIS